MDKLRALQLINDNMRQEFLGVVLFSKEFHAMPADFKREALQRVRHYRAFHPDGHHDAGMILMKPPVQWHIEYRSPDLKGKSTQPLDCEKTVRVLIVELA